MKAALGTGGLTNSTGTMVHLLLLPSGDEPSHVDIWGWRYGPRRLRASDTNIMNFHGTSKIGTTVFSRMRILSRAAEFAHFRVISTFLQNSVTAGGKGKNTAYFGCA